MKTKFLLVLAITIATMANAQMTGRRAMGAAASQSNTGTITLGKLIAQLTENINPAAFKPAFLQNERNFIQKGKQYRTGDGVSRFSKKPASWFEVHRLWLRLGRMSSQWITDANNIQTVQDAANLVNTLSDNLDPASYAPQWGQDKPTFKSSIGSVTQ